MPVTLFCVVCGEPFSVIPSRVEKGAKYCNYKCHQIGEGRKGGAVRAEQKKTASEGKAYTKTKGRHTHRRVAEKKLGRPLEKGEIVHHKDGDKLNNSPDNLEVMTQSDHVREHIDDMLKKRREKHAY